MNKLLLVFIISLLGISCEAQKTETNKLQAYVDEFALDSCFQSAGLGIVISNVKTGENLAANQAHLALTPASTQKLITTAAALEILGSNYQFKTQIKTDGELLANGTLTGNLIVKGFGDPTLGSKYFTDNESVGLLIAEKIKALGINKIKGKIITDDSYINPKIPSTWIWEDIANYYGAIPNGLSFHDNLYTLFFSSGKAGSTSRLVKTEPQNTGLLFDNHVVSSSINRDLAYIFGGNTSNKRRIEGSIPQNRAHFRVKGALLHPKNSLAETLNQSFRHAGIKLENKTFSGEGMQLLISLNSPKLKEIVKLTNQKSINLFADHLLFEIGNKEFGKASWENGIEAVNNFWEQKGLATKYISLYDGSGLSHFNAVPADFFDQVLRVMYHSEYANEFISSLPVAGISGTLKSFGKNSDLRGNWKSKTGSMTGVRTYCGYLQTKSGKEYAVTILINNYFCSSSTINNKLLTLLNKLYNS
ncbi:D-alanyl-D-alanine carboxypeptidase/D-alanyl-D-alanine endopeptidase [Labilibaculum antarcticum]|uniref:D-alanyl-D-alanine carboxypeptidase/D-alanyl-D-alanine-endopeptidase n=1 Tax=Labilibaculum antarcticum TaxID=1717717 RepID=A0A1Y1CG54_9BACT|nr:D-alanyl-D-alanine carboxypeptidase/D-alanyl-D-alanine-endopeptidase [Labilibaculum antarcticum]BAX79349.1 D-alanyl-D-alanine carboxypeptidase/D-alanyl-D-alanine-endopeptidase [Labilibaculum antarcticum]